MSGQNNQEQPPTLDDIFASPSSTEECIVHFREQYNCEPDTYTLAAISEAETAAAAFRLSEAELKDLRWRVRRGVPISLPDGTVTKEGPPPTDDMVIELGRRERIWNGWRTHPYIVIGLLNLIDDLMGDGGEAVHSQTTDAVPRPKGAKG